MGKTKDFARGKAEFLEPSPPESVIMRGEVEHRRPGPPGASPEEEARHGANLRPVPAHLAVRPEDPARVDRGSQEPGAMAPPGIPVVPPEVHDRVPDDRQSDGRAVEACGASRERKRAKRREKRRIQVVKIDLMKYPAYRCNPDHLFMGMAPERRNDEIIGLCAQLWARACEERAQVGQPAVKPTPPEVRARAA